MKNSNNEIILTKEQCMNVIERTGSNLEAAEYLHIHVSTWRKYADMYIHDETGVSLYEYHKSYTKRNSYKGHVNSKYPLDEILEGKHPDYNYIQLKKRLLKSPYFKEECSYCGYQERRMSDYTIPLLLHYKDEDKTNHKKENLEFLCYNCFYILVGNFFGKGKKVTANETKPYL